MREGTASAGLKLRLGFALAFLVLMPVSVLSQVSFGSSRLLNSGWKFALEDNPGFREFEYDDSDWEDVVIPHDWSVKGQLDPDLASCTGYLPGGIGWYRKTILIPSDSIQGNKVFLYFEGVYNRSDVYVNGHLLGHRPNGYISFLYDATPYIRFNESNTIAVRVDHSRSADSRWYTGSGIYRNVWLIRSRPVHLSQWGVFAYPVKAGPDTGELKVETEIANESLEAVELVLKHELLSVEGDLVSEVSTARQIPAGSTGKGSLTLSVESPERWSVDEPHLYTLKTTLWQEGEVIDETSFRTGIREFRFDPDKGFKLNGVSMKMKGVCLHHDAGVLGAAVPREVWKKRLQALKDIGCNAIRTSHNPQSPDLYDLCDELGFLVLDEAFDEWEFPKRKWLKGWNVGEPGFQGSYDFFPKWGERDLADMVRRDRNHPSIFAWSIGNEVDYPNDPYSHPVLDGSSISQPMFGGYDPERPDANRLGDIAKVLVGVVKEHDTSRPVTAALAGVVMSNETEYPGALDIVGYNYTEDRYAQDHKKYPNRVIYGSENRHGYQDWLAVRDNDYIFGQFLWTGIDYLGESGRWPSRGMHVGLLDLGGFIKPLGYYRKAMWSTEPTITICTMPKPKGSRRSFNAWPTWNYENGEKVRVICFTNAQKAELILNGERVGKAKSPDKETGVISWDIPFAAGKLEVTGLDASGTELCRDSINTAGEPANLSVSCETGTLNREGGVAMLVVRVVDEKGTSVMNSDLDILCSIEGPARLLGLEASNNRDMGDYTDNVQHAYHGRLLAYIQATGQPGEITVSFSSESLPVAKVHLEAP